jgi:hypothetical protein
LSFRNRNEQRLQPTRNAIGYNVTRDSDWLENFRKKRQVEIRRQLVSTLSGLPKKKRIGIFLFKFLSTIAVG